MDDMIYNTYHDISELPQQIVNRLIHYFTTYKDLPNDREPRMVLTHIYGAKTACEVINRSIEDYNNEIATKVDK